MPRPRNSSEPRRTWKAILSDKDDENNWAINRVGYNWSTLKLLDGTTVAAAALWNGSTLNYPINRTELGTTLSSTATYSNTTASGKPYSTMAGAACNNFTTGNTTIIRHGEMWD